ncbi:adenosine receptor A2b-like [Acropora palmata]|uniref:adenosine receptor A2b-like n=1 Tax=Acropora palmata TaxID=6131 RepID=UPI003DA065EF
MANDTDVMNATVMSPGSGDDKSFFHPVYDGFLIVLSVFVIAINLLVIFLFVYREYLQTKTNSLLISLAVSDLMAGFLGIPLTIVCNAVLQDGVCIASVLIYRFIAVSTMYHILIVTLERYIYVMYPMKYINIVTVPRLLMVIASVWLFSLFTSLIQFSWQNPNRFFTKRDPVVLEYSLGYNIVGALICFFLPALFMAISYVRMFLVIHRQIKEIQGLYNTRTASTANQRAPIATEARALFIFALMLTVFTLCWLSFYITGILFCFIPSSAFPTKAFMVFDFIRFTVAFVNPILYAFLKRDFSRALRSLCKRDVIQPGEQASTSSASRFRNLTINFSLSRSSDMYREG